MTPSVRFVPPSLPAYISPSSPLVNYALTQSSPAALHMSAIRSSFSTPRKSNRQSRSRSTINPSDVWLSLSLSLYVCIMPEGGRGFEWRRRRFPSHQFDTLHMMMISNAAAAVLLESPRHISFPIPQLACGMTMAPRSRASDNARVVEAAL